MCIPKDGADGRLLRAGPAALCSVLCPAFADLRFFTALEGAALNTLISVLAHISDPLSWQAFLKTFEGWLRVSHSLKSWFRS